MKILITNTVLIERSGSELYVKEVAEGLTSRGHTVAAYSNSIGKLAETMARQGIQAVDDLSELSWVPDIIHGQHHLEAMTALAYFPNVPAVYFCHGWKPWEESPPLHPRIIEYAAVDSATRDYAVRQYKVPPDKIRLIHNFVDITRFKERGPLPDKPAKALVFSNYATEDNYLPLVRQACLKAGISLDIIGYASGHQVEQPESVLKDYDLIFAVGRSALEALATGASVVICGIWGVGPMVTLQDMDTLRDLNFGVAAMHSKPDTDAIYREICRYNAEDSSALTKNLRAKIDIKPALDKVERLYVEAIEKYNTADIRMESEARSLSLYLRNTSTYIKQKNQELQQKDWLSQQNARIVQLKEQELQLKDQIIQQKDQTIQQKDQELQLNGQTNQQQKNELQLNDQIIQQKDKEIRRMKSSNFWKLREFYMKARNFIIKKHKP